ncbi:uncharacterized protein LOC106138825 isoform X2 [Amyelois transitella]|nr:uncharacterized protein LOC106138825 isoform X2 [Amyelois transitella]
MGKLFSDPGQGSSMTPCGGGGCRMGGCCHGHGSPCAGEGYSSMNNHNQCMNKPCMGIGKCNPPKLYADTYNYLNKNLMQPIVNEVYNDLKSISPANTVMNNPMAAQMGLSPMNQAMTGQGNVPGMTPGNLNEAGGTSGMPPVHNMAMSNSNASQPGQQNQYMGQMGQSMGQMNQMNQPSNQMGGMGSQIMKMMMGDKPSTPDSVPPTQNGQLNDSMLINAPQSPHGQVGVVPLEPVTYGTSGRMPSTNYGQDNVGYYSQNPTTQYMSNGYSGNAMNTMPQNNVPQYNMTSNTSGMGQNVQANTQPMATNRSYGHHAQGIKKFNEMFPGVMQGDLGFDPMAIAIQMNPANQQKAAMTAMEQLMHGKKVIDPNSSVMQPAINAANLVNTGFTQSGNAPSQGAPMVQTNQQLPYQNQLQPVQYQQPMQQQQLMPQQQSMQQHQPVPQQQSMQQQQPVPQQQSLQQQQPVPQQQSMQQQQLVPQQQFASQQQVVPQQQPGLNQTPGQYQIPIQPQSPLQQQVDNTNTYQVPPQQVYTAATGSAMHYQPDLSRTTYQYQQQPQQQMPQQLIDPNTGAITNTPNLPGGYEQMANPNAEMQNATPKADPNQMIMEPIFPADTAKNNAITYSHHIKNPKNYYYNTLGQPVQMLDAKMYHAPPPSGPQTLSPQPIPAKQATRNQPQTFSNVKNTVSKTSIMGNDKLGRTPSRNQLQHLYNQYKGSQSFTQQNINAPLHHHTHSEGKLNETLNTSAPRHVPVERVGGDTIANNVVNNQMVNKLEPSSAPMGDVGDVNKPQGDGAAAKDIPLKTTKGRNGLQDMVFTSGPMSAAWTFHGNNHMPYSAGYKFRSKVR